MINKNPYQKAYENNRILSASRGELVVMLYESAIRFNENAIENMSFKTYDKVNHYIGRAMEIVAELKTSLNLEAGGEVAQNLNDLYDYMLEQLRLANARKDKALLTNVNSMLHDLLEAWKTITQKPLASDPRYRSADHINGFSTRG